MRLSSFRSVHSLQTNLFLGAVAMALLPAPLVAQSFCGPTTVVTFNGTSDGGGPGAGVTFDRLGNMYGTTSGGGTVSGGGSGFGTIWKYTPSTGLTTLFTFSGSSTSSNNGYNSQSPLVIDAQGNLYGATYGGGNTGLGNLFELSASGQFTQLHQFSGPDGLNPIGSLVLDSQGNLWGATIQGGPTFNNNSGYGTIFKYSGGTLTNPASFNITDGEYAESGIATDGTNFYGTTNQGDANGLGTLFQYNPTTGQLTTLINFNGSGNGSNPQGGLIYDGKGNLYGTTTGGGSGSSGTVWKYSISTGQLTTLVNFDGNTVPADGSYPIGAVTLDGNGNIFGSTYFGGTFGDGIVYEYSSAGVLSTLATFSGANGQAPKGGLAFDGSGNLWGVTNSGGSSGYGTLYKLTPNTGGGCGPTVSSLTFNPSSIQNGAATTGTVTLSAPAPSGGSSVGLSDNNPSFLVIPGTVTVPAGATTATFQAGATNGFVNSNTPVTVTATLGNSTTQGSVTVTAGVAVKSIVMNPSTITAGNTATGTVTLTTPAPSGGNEVDILTNTNDPANPLALILPITVEIPAGQSSANFSFGTRPVTTTYVNTVYAQSGGATVSTSLTVKAASSSGPTVSSVTLNPTSVTGGSNSTGTVTLSSAAPSGGTVVSLSSNSGSASVPSSVTVPSRSTSATFNVTTTSVTTTTTATITATLGSSSQQASLTITPASGGPTVSSVTLNPTSVTGGSSSTGTVTLSSAAPSGGTVVSLSSNSSSASVSSSVTVPSGSTSATFTVTTTSVSTALTATITATLGSSSQQASLTITPASGSVTLSSLTLNPTSVSGGNNSTGTVTLTGAAPSGGASVALSSSNTSVATVPSSVTVSAGQTSASFTVRTQRVSSNTNVLISGTYAGTTQNATLTVTGRRH
jgi:uncharacterized repeat protein (TIGR03803 family)